MIQFTKNKLFHENNDNDIFERFLMIFIVKTSRYRIVKNLKKIVLFWLVVPEKLGFMMPKTFIFE